MCALGTASSTSRGSTCARRLLCTSTTGEEPVTVTVSSSAPTFIAASIVAVKSLGSSTPVALEGLEARIDERAACRCRAARSTILYWPDPSVVAMRLRSMSAGLVASTVTPGIAEPDVSFTTPARALCARTAVGYPRRQISAASSTPPLKRIMGNLLAKLKGKNRTSQEGATMTHDGPLGPMVEHR